MSPGDGNYEHLTAAIPRRGFVLRSATTSLAGQGLQLYRRTFP